MERKNIKNNRNTNRYKDVTNNEIKESSEIMRVKKKYNPKFVMMSNLFELHLIFLSCRPNTDLNIYQLSIAFKSIFFNLLFIFIIFLKPLSHGL